MCVTVWHEGRKVETVKELQEVIPALAVKRTVTSLGFLLGPPVESADLNHIDIIASCLGTPYEAVPRENGDWELVRRKQ